MPSYIDTSLRPGERIIYRPRLSRFLLGLNGILAVLCLAAIAYFGLMAMVYAGQFNWKFFGRVPREDFLLAVIIILFACLLLYYSTKYFYDYFQAEIALTDQRIIGKTRRLFAAFSLQCVDLPLSDLEKVYHVTGEGGGGGSADSGVGVILYIIASIILGLANYGTVVVVDKEGRKTKFRSIAAPGELDRQISQAAGIGKFAAPGPASAAAGGVAEKALSRGFNWKLIVGWTGAVLIIGVAIWAYYDTGWKSAKERAKAPARTTSVPQAPASKPPPTAEGYVQQGLREKDPQQKIALYTRAIEQDPNNAAAFNNRGYVYYTRKNLDLARRDLDRAIALKPDYVAAYYNRGSVNYDRANYDLALADFSQAIKLKPDFAAAYYNRGLTYFSQKNYDRAIADYSQALGLKPDYAAAYNGRGNAWFRKKDFDQAVNDYSQAISLKPDFAMAHVNRGNALFAKKDYDEARKDYDRAIALKPDYALAYYRRAVICQQRGEAEQARQDYTKARSLNPKLPELPIK